MTLTATVDRTADMTAPQQRALDYIARHNGIGEENVDAILGPQGFRVLDRLVDRGVLVVQRTASGLRRWRRTA